MKKVFCFILVCAMMLSLFGCALETPKHDASNAVHQSAAPAPDAPPPPTPEDLELIKTVLTDAKERKDAILNSPTEIVKADEYIPGETYTGTAYYVSNNGSDHNNGLSPETAFATLDYFWNHDAQPGDAIFFERGSTWRLYDIPWRLRQVDRITYSAYGEGPKPQLFGSPESGVGEEKWTLVHEDGDKKIWQFYKPMSEVASIVLNDEKIVVRDVAYWDGNAYHCIEGTHNLEYATEELYDWREHLENMQCFPELFYENAELFDPSYGFTSDTPVFLQGPDGARIYINGHDQYGRDTYHTGNLYFRCDEGNPGALFDELEFIYGFIYFDGMTSHTVLDNLAIKYCGGNTTPGQGFADRPETEYCIVQNCEFGWMGGAVTGYAVDAINKKEYFCSMGCYFQQGGAMSLTKNHCTARNNYYHHAFQDACTIETFQDGPSITGTSIHGNLMEACAAPISLLNWDEEVDMNHIFTNCTVEDNIVLFSGEETWFHNTKMLRCENPLGVKPGPCPHDGTLSVRNNVFAFTEYAEALVYIHSYDENFAKIYDNNTYIQYYGKGTFNAEGKDDFYFGVNHMDHDFIAQYLGDQSPTTALVYREDVDALRESLDY